ncbi:hypothetical protein AAMO2058_000133600 [Amorphochlora amoebiformis]
MVLNFPLDIKKKNGNGYDTNKVGYAVLSRLGKRFPDLLKSIREVYKKIKKIPRVSRLSLRIALEFYAHFNEIPDRYDRNFIMQSYFAFRKCFRAVLHKYFSLTNNTRMLSNANMQRRPEEDESFLYVVDAHLSGSCITINRRSYDAAGIQDTRTFSRTCPQTKGPAHKHQGLQRSVISGTPILNRKRSQDSTGVHALYPQSRQKKNAVYSNQFPQGDSIPESSVPRTTATTSSSPQGSTISFPGGKKARIRDSPQGSKGVGVTMVIKLGRTPRFDYQQKLVEWTCIEVKRIEENLSAMLDLNDIETKLGPGTVAPTIKFPKLIDQILEHWKLMESDVKKVDDDFWTLSFKFEKENYFKDKDPDSYRHEQLLDYCKSIIENYHIKWETRKAEEGCIICKFNIPSSEIPKVNKLRDSILQDFRILLAGKKIMCMPIMCTTRLLKPKSARTIINDQKPVGPRKIDVMIETNWSTAVCIINKLLELDDWTAPTFRIRRIQVFPVNTHPLGTKDLRHLGDCLPSLETLMKISHRIFKKCSPHLVANVLGLIVEFWAFDAIPNHLDQPTPSIERSRCCFKLKFTRKDRMDDRAWDIYGRQLRDKDTVKKWMLTKSIRFGEYHFESYEDDEYYHAACRLQRVTLVEPRLNDLFNLFPAERLGQLATIVSDSLLDVRSCYPMGIFQIIVNYISFHSSKVVEDPSEQEYESETFKYFLLDRGSKREMASKELFMKVPDNGFWRKHFYTQDAEPFEFYKQVCLHFKLATEDKATKQIIWPQENRRQRKVIELLTTYVLCRDAEHKPSSTGSKDSEDTTSDRVVGYDLYVLHVHRFGFNKDMIHKAEEFYVREGEQGELKMVPWYHGVLNDYQIDEIMRGEKNGDQFLVREKIVNDSKTLAVEYSNDKKGSLRGFKKKILMIEPDGFQWLSREKPRKKAEVLGRYLRIQMLQLSALHDDIIDATYGPIDERNKQMYEKSRSVEVALKDLTARSYDGSKRSAIRPANYGTTYAFNLKIAEAEGTTPTSSN